MTSKSDGTIPNEDYQGRPKTMGETVCPPRLPEEAETRKRVPMARGLLDYFPDALAYVAYVSQLGNEQHNPGQPLHWARSKSTDHADCLMRHMVDRGLKDAKGVRHSGQVAWRALAMLQREMEEELGLPPPRGAGE